MYGRFFCLTTINSIHVLGYLRISECRQLFLYAYMYMYIRNWHDNINNLILLVYVCIRLFIPCMCVKFGLSCISNRMDSLQYTALLKTATSGPSRFSWTGGQTCWPEARYAVTGTISVDPTSYVVDEFCCVEAISPLSCEVGYPFISDNFISMHV